MRLIKYDNTLDESLGEMDHWLERAFGGFVRTPSLFNGNAPRHGFKVNIYDDANNHYIVGELPGVDKNALKIELENAVLTISGERKYRKGDEEVTSTEFSRSLIVCDDVEAGRVTAKLEHGILTVTLPKIEARKPHAISVS
jgi:HSP20 family protein